MLDDVLQQQVVLEDPLDGLEQIRTERKCVLQLRLSLAASSTGCLIPHQVRQHRHFPISNYIIAINAI